MRPRGVGGVFHCSEPGGPTEGARGNEPSNLVAKLSGVSHVRESVEDLEVWLISLSGMGSALVPGPQPANPLGS